MSPQTEAGLSCPRCSEPMKPAPNAPGKLKCPSCGLKLSVPSGDASSENPPPENQPPEIPPRRPNQMETQLAETMVAVPGDEEESPPEIPGYQVLERSGRSSIGIVYRAIQEAFSRVISLKILHREVCSDPAALARFEREARILGQLQHPAIETVYDGGKTDDGRFYMALEQLAGRPLREHIKDEGFGTLDRIDILCSVADALAYAHENRVIHRDLRPETLYLDRGNRRNPVKVIDFGLAAVLQEESSMDRLTRVGVVLGSPLYMAPEQHTSPRSVTGRADMYSFGVIAYQFLTRRFPGRNYVEPSELNPQVPRALDRVLSRTLQPEPADRYPDMNAVIDDIRRALRTRPSQVTSSFGAVPRPVIELDPHVTSEKTLAIVGQTSPSKEVVVRVRRPSMQSSREYRTHADDRGCFQQTVGLYEGHNQIAARSVDPEIGDLPDEEHFCQAVDVRVTPDPPRAAAPPSRTEEGHVLLKGHAKVGYAVGARCANARVEGRADADGTFQLQVPLQKGQNLISLWSEIDDIPSNDVHFTVHRQLDPPRLVPLPPIVSGAHLTIRGETSPSAAVEITVGLNVNRVEADDRGRFETLVYLTMGRNRIVALARKGDLISPACPPVEIVRKYSRLLAGTVVVCILGLAVIFVKNPNPSTAPEPRSSDPRLLASASATASPRPALLSRLVPEEVLLSRHGPEDVRIEALVDPDHRLELTTPSYPDPIELQPDRSGRCVAIIETGPGRHPFTLRVIGPEGRGPSVEREIDLGL